MEKAGSRVFEVRERSGMIARKTRTIVENMKVQVDKMIN